MKRNIIVVASLLFLGLVPASAQLWNGLLGSVTSSCTGSTSPSGCAIDWSSAGIPGGIPSTSWTQSGSTILAATYSNGSTDASSAVNSALASCGTNHYVLLGAGTFSFHSAVGVPSNCALRGAGANQTTVNCYVTGNACIYAGLNSGGASDSPPSLSSATAITGGLTAGSTSITVASTSGMSVGGFLLISQLNDPNFVSNSAAANNGGSICNCDGGIGWNGTRNMGQIVQITSIAGTTVGITSGGTGALVNPGLYYPYNNSPLAVPFNESTSYAGIEGLQVYAEDSGAMENFYLGNCAYCWVNGVESNYTDGNWAEIDWGFHDQISNSYMSNAFGHTSGTNDSNITVRTFTSGSLIQNNILERGHFPLMLEWGAAGNVIAYNYIFGQYDIIDFQNGGSNVVDPCSTVNTPCSNTPAIDAHGAHPQFNLVEGNVGNMFEPDNIWGSSSWWTTFRNWWQGTTQMCGNGNAGGLGRGTSSSCSDGVYAWQIANDYEIEAFSTRTNLVGDIVGSSQQQSLVSTQGGKALAPLQQVEAQCGTSPCGANSRPYGTYGIDFSLGYFSVSSTGGGTYDELTPATTLFVHGVYNSITSLVSWVTGLTHTLPNSLYLSGKPSWWSSSLAYPAIGPDITGGSGPGNMTNLTPAENCYQKIMGGTSPGGSGTPLLFNAATCYGAAAVPGTPLGLSFTVTQQQ
jgi:hypothetical protein